MNNQLENILTRSAKEELEKHLSEEKDIILNDAYKNASSSETQVQEISLRDILDAKDRKRNKDFQLKNSTYKRKRITALITMSGVLYTIIGFLLYLYQNVKFDIADNLGLIVASIGILITFMAFFFNQMYLLKGKRSFEDKINNKYLSESDFSIVERWTVIEKLTRELIEKESNETPKSFNQILSYLKNDKVFSEQEQLELTKLLSLRNNILHENINISNSKRKEYIEMADNLINKLEKEK